MADPVALVHGLAITGTSVVRALRRHGYDVIVSDDRIDDSKRELAASLAVELREAPADWAATLRGLAAHFGQSPEVHTEVVCVDKRRQWSRWTNIWHSSAIRSTGYTLAAPWRGVRAMTHRGAA